MSEQQPTFEQAYARLEQVVRQLEGAPVGLDEALKLYEEGMANLKSCQKLLEAAERRIELVTQASAAGEASTVPFDDDDAQLHEKVGRRRARPAGLSAAEAKGESAGKGRSSKPRSKETSSDEGADGSTMDEGELLF